MLTGAASSKSSPTNSACSTISDCAARRRCGSTHVRPAVQSTPRHENSNTSRSLRSRRLTRPDPAARSPRAQPIVAALRHGVRRPLTMRARRGEPHRRRRVVRFLTRARSMASRSTPDRYGALRAPRPRAAANQRYDARLNETRTVPRQPGSERDQERQRWPPTAPAWSSPADAPRTVQRALRPARRPPARHQQTAARPYRTLSWDPSSTSPSEPAPTRRRPQDATTRTQPHGGSPATRPLR